MTYTPNAAAQTALPTVLSNLPRQQREQAIVACAQLTNRIDKGLDLTEEIRTVLTQRTGDVVLIFTRATLEGFAICVHGAGSEAGTRTCYVKFGAARNDNSFDRLLAACEAFAGSHGVDLEAGVNFARENAYRRMKARGYRTMTQGVAMLRPHVAGFNRTNAYVIDDWR